MEIVKNIKTLQGMEKKGLITLHPHTGKKVWWNGQEVRAWYIDDSKNRLFGYYGKKYEVKYQSGSFYPYVYDLKQYVRND